MAHKKGAGSTKNGRDSNPKFLGLKKHTNFEKVNAGNILVRQRGSNIMAGKNVGYGKDFTLFAKKSGYLKFYNITKNRKALKVIERIKTLEEKNMDLFKFTYLKKLI
jgi:large subunit ribosomal protein L27